MTILGGKVNFPVVDPSVLDGKNVIGIDPGSSPTFACFVGGQDTVEFYGEEQTGIRVKTKQMPNLNFIDTIFQGVPPDVVVMEWVTPMPRWGATATSTFIGGFRHLWGFIEGRRLPLMLLPPKKWQSITIVTKGGEAHRKRAMELFPQHAGMLGLKKHEHRAAAMLVALAGAMVCRGRMGGYHPAGVSRGEYVGEFWRSWLTEEDRQTEAIMETWDD